MNETGTSCACLKVGYNPEHIDRGIKERWTCELCETEFIRKGLHEYLLSRVSCEGELLEDAAFALLMHIQKQLEQEPGWMQYEFYTPEIDMYLYNRLSEALGSKDHAKSSELLRRYERVSEERPCEHKGNMLLNPNTGMLHCPKCNTAVPVSEGLAPKE